MHNSSNHSTDLRTVYECVCVCVLWIPLTLHVVMSHSINQGSFLLCWSGRIPDDLPLFHTPSSQMRGVACFAALALATVAPIFHWLFVAQWTHLLLHQWEEYSLKSRLLPSFLPASTLMALSRASFRSRWTLKLILNIWLCRCDNQAMCD